MDDILTRAEGYRRQAMIIGRAQYMTSEGASKSHNRIGIPVVVLSTVVGTSIFATISKDPHVVLGKALDPQGNRVGVVSTVVVDG